MLRTGTYNAPVMGATNVPATGMGQIGTFGTNVLLLNTTNGAFTSTIATQ